MNCSLSLVGAPDPFAGGNSNLLVWGLTAAPSRRAPMRPARALRGALGVVRKRHARAVRRSGARSPQAAAVLASTEGAIPRADAPTHSGAACCFGAPSAIMPLPRRSAGRGLGSSLLHLRRTTAVPRAFAPTAFSFGGVRSHGLVAPAEYLQDCGLTPCGNPSGLLFPKVQSANPHGAAHLLAEGDGSRASSLGAPAMSNHTPAASIAAYAPHTVSATVVVPSPSRVDCFSECAALLALPPSAVAELPADYLDACEDFAEECSRKALVTLRLIGESGVLAGDDEFDPEELRRRSCATLLMSAVLRFQFDMHEKRREAELYKWLHRNDKGGAE